MGLRAGMYWRLAALRNCFRHELRKKESPKANQIIFSLNAWELDNIRYMGVSLLSELAFSDQNYSGTSGTGVYVVGLAKGNIILDLPLAASYFYF